MLRSGTARPLPTAGANDDASSGMSRPMTAIKGAGYTAMNKQKLFDPLRMSFSGGELATFDFEPEVT